MCGRTRCSLAQEDVVRRTGVPRERWRDRERFTPTYNAAPGRYMPIMKNGQDGQRDLQSMKWGLVPNFTKKDAKPDHWRMFNARSETLTESPVFRRLLGTKRCVVIVDGFYEWKTEGQHKQPYYLNFGDDVMKFAGLYDCWEGVDDELLYTFTIITTNSSQRIQWLHSRMPVVLRSAEAEARWLSGTEESDIRGIDQQCISYNGEDLVWHPVTSKMSKLGFDGPECAMDVRKKGLASFFKAKVAMSPSKDEQKDVPENTANEEAEKPTVNDAKTEQSFEKNDEFKKVLNKESNDNYFASLENKVEDTTCSKETVKSTADNKLGMQQECSTNVNSDVKGVKNLAGADVQHSPSKHRSGTNRDSSLKSTSTPPLKKQKTTTDKGRITAFFTKKSA